MSFIQVPIGKGITKFPNIKRSIPEFTKGSISRFENDITFLKDKADRDSYVQLFASNSTAGAIVSITPDTGTTFYFLAGQCTNDSGSEDTFTLTSDQFSTLGQGGLTNTVETRILQDNEVYKFACPILRLVGNMSDSIAIEHGDFSGSASMYGWIENTQRP